MKNRIKTLAFYSLLYSPFLYPGTEGFHATRDIDKNFTVFDENERENSLYYLKQKNLQEHLSHYIKDRINSRYKMTIEKYYNEVKRNPKYKNSQFNRTFESFSTTLSQKISKNAFEVSEVFEVDPIILIALIEKESMFSPEALSPTGAVGLTQMTRIAIEEILMQTGLIPGEARQTTVNYLKDKIHETKSYNWIHPTIDEYLRDFKNIREDIFYTKYDKNGEVIRRGLKTKYVRTIKEYFFKNTWGSILYAVVLLKVNYAFSCGKLRNCKYRDSTDWQKKEITKKALEAYNGDTTMYTLRSGQSQPIKYWYRERVWNIAVGIKSFVQDRQEKGLNKTATFSQFH